MSKEGYTEFKHLSESISFDEARKACHSLAKQLHSDIGEDEDEFEILTHEYFVIGRRTSESTIANISDTVEAAGAMVGVIAQTLRELYPRTRAVLNYTSFTIEAEFYGSVPVERMITIEQVINSFGYPFSVVVLSKQNVKKTAIILFTKNNVTWINIPQEVGMGVKGTPIYSGRRYTIHRGGKHEQCEDKENPHLYVMRRIPKYSLQGLLGIGK